MVAFQNFNYRSLPEAKKEIYFGDIKHCFDALSFCTYYSSLNHQQKSELSKILFDHCDKNMSNEERKCRKEYESLFHYLQMPNNPYRDYSISKETRPDFVLAGERAVGMHQHRRDLCRTPAAFFESFNDHFAGLVFILAVNLLCGHQARAGDGTVKIIGVGGAPGGEIQPGL